MVWCGVCTLHVSVTATTGRCGAALPHLATHLAQVVVDGSGHEHSLHSPDPFHNTPLNGKMMRLKRGRETPRPEVPVAIGSQLHRPHSDVASIKLDAEHSSANPKMPQ